MSNQPVDTAWVEVKPETGNFIPQLQRDLNRAFKGVETTISQSLGGVGRQFDKMGTNAQQSFAGVAKSADREFAKVDTVAKQRARQAGQSFHDSFTSVLRRGVQAVGLAITGVMAAALTKGFGRLKAIDDARAKLTGLGHDAKTVQQIMDNAMAAVKGTAFGFGEAASLAASMVAAGIAPGKELEKVLRLVGDSATIAGSDLTEMGAIWGKVAATGRLQGDEMQQLTERGIPILQLLAKHYKVTAAEAREMVSKGKVDFKAFAEAMESSMGGAALKSGNTFTGAMRNMGAALSRFGAGLIGGVFEQMPGVFSGIISWIDKITPAAKSAGEWLGKAFKSGLDTVKSWIPTLQGIWNGLVAVYKLVVERDFTGELSRSFGIEEDSPIIIGVFAIRDALVSAWKTLQPWVGTLKEFLLTYGGYIVLFAGIAGALQKVRTAIALLGLALTANPWLLFIAGLATAVTLIVKNWDTIKGKIGEVLDWIPKHAGEILPTILSTIGGWWSSLQTTLGEVFGKVATWLKDSGIPAIAKELATAGGAIWDWVKDTAPQFLDSITTAIHDGVTNMTSGDWGKALEGFFDGIFDWIGQQGPVLLGGMADLWQKVWDWMNGPGLTDAVNAVGEMLGTAVGWIGTHLAELMLKITPQLGLLIAKLSVWLATGQGALLLVKLAYAFVSGFIGGIATAISDSNIDDILLGWLETIGSTVNEWLDGVVEEIKREWGVITGWLSQKWSEFTEGWNGFWNGLGATVSTAWGTITGWISGKWTEFKAGWDGFWNGLGRVVSDVWAAIAGYISHQWNEGILAPMKAQWEMVSGWFSEKWNQFSTAWSNFWNGVSAIASTIWGTIKLAVMLAWNTITTWFSERWTSFVTGWNNFWNGVGATVSGWWNTIKLGIQTKWNEITTWFSGRWTAFTTSWNSFWGGVGRAISEKWDGFKKTLGDKWEVIRKFFADKWGTFTKWTSDTWNAIGRGISSVWSNLTTWISRPVQSALEWLQKNLVNKFNALMDILHIGWHIPPIWTAPANSGSSNIQGRKKGGWTGNVGTDQFAGFVHGREWVINAKSTAGLLRDYGAGFLNMLNGYAAGGWVSPVVGYSPAFPWGRYPSGGIHRALDYAVPTGTRVLAPDDGRVVKAGWDPTGYGISVFLDHMNGLFSVLGHMRNIVVSYGRFVGAGQLLGYSDNTGRSTGPHLHWGVMQGGIYGPGVNPGLVSAAGGLDIKKMLADFVRTVSGGVSNGISALTSLFGPIGMLVGGMGRKLLSFVTEKALDALGFGEQGGGRGSAKPRVLDQGGWLMPGWNPPSYNGTGRPEPVGWGTGGSTVINVHMTVSVDDLAKMSKIGDFIQMLEDARIENRRTERSGRVSA